MIDWSKVKWFKPSEFGEHADKIDPLLVYSLDALRDFVKRPIRINSAYRPGDDGQHGLGKAADIVIAGLGCMDAFFVAERTRLFTGIGVYPFWHLPGIHVDVRELRPNEHGARWGRNKEGVYVNLDWKFVKSFA
jgi:uncharacterized protein YcbK (DUF882 family)